MIIYSVLEAYLGLQKGKLICQLSGVKQVSGLWYTHINIFWQFLIKKLLLKER